MAKVYEPTEKQIKEWSEWVQSRPDNVRMIAERFTPWTLYKLKSTDQKVGIRSFNEDGTMSIIVSGKYNVVMFDRCVFGINPDDLEECDLPEEGQLVGALLSQEEAQKNIEYIRALMGLSSAGETIQ